MRIVLALLAALALAACAPKPAGGLAKSLGKRTECAHQCSLP